MNYKFLIIYFSLFVLGCEGAKESSDNESKVNENEKKISNHNYNQIDLSIDTNVLKGVIIFTQKEWTLDKLCIKRPPMFRDLVTVGFKEFEEGCVGGLIFYKGEQFEIWPCSSFMFDHGWSNPKNRSKLAREYTEHVMFPWLELIEADNGDFGKDGRPKWSPPTITIDRDHIFVKIWFKDLPGINGEKFYENYEIVFSPEGNVISKESVDRFMINI